MGVHNCKQTVWHDNHSIFGRRLSPLGHRDKDLCESRLTTFSSAGINPLTFGIQGHCSILSAMGLLTYLRSYCPNVYTVLDLGHSLNPGIDVGQIEGAFVMGMGMVTTEQLLRNYS